MLSDPVQLASTLGSRPLELLLVLLVTLGFAILAVSVAVGWVARRRDALWRTAARAFRWVARRRAVERLDARFPALRRALASFDPHEYLLIHTALALALCLAGLLFVKLADSVSEADIVVHIDLAFAAAVHRSASDTGLTLLRAFSALGSGWALTVLCLFVLIALLLKGRRILAIGWVIALAGVGILNAALKAAFTRPRPTFDAPHEIAAGWSFPSGHSMGTFVAAGMIAYLALLSARTRPRGWFVVALAAAWTLAMGFSRLYLGVHYLSDVVGGFAAGTVWLVACISGTEIARRGSINGRAPSRARSNR